jgi:hypothetical protein
MRPVRYTWTCQLEQRRREDERVAAGQAVRLPLYLVGEQDIAEAIEGAKARKLAELRAVGDQRALNCWGHRACIDTAMGPPDEGAHVGQSGLTDLGERSANKSRVSPVRCASPVAPLSQQRSNVESRGSDRLRCNCIRKASPTRKGCPCVLPVQFRRSAGAFTRTRSGEG